MVTSSSDDGHGQKNIFNFRKKSDAIRDFDTCDWFCINDRCKILEISSTLTKLAVPLQWKPALLYEFLVQGWLKHYYNVPHENMSFIANQRRIIVSLRIIEGIGICYPLKIITLKICVMLISSTLKLMMESKPGNPVMKCSGKNLRANCCKDIRGWIADWWACCYCWPI